MTKLPNSAPLALHVVEEIVAGVGEIFGRVGEREMLEYLGRGEEMARVKEAKKTPRQRA